MLKSMTAFSRKESVSDWGTLVWEMRSVNHRYLDVSIRIADELRLIEPQVREKINLKLSRGKVEVSLRFCLLYTSPSPRDGLLSRMPSSA